VLLQYLLTGGPGTNQNRYRSSRTSADWGEADPMRQ